MYIKAAFIFLFCALVSAVISCPSYGAYDPSSQSWGAASITGSGGNTCTVNRIKSGGNVTWFTCAYNSTTSTYTLTFTVGFFPLAPICEITPSGLPLVFYFPTDPTTTSATIVSVTLLNILSNGTFFITCR